MREQLPDYPGELLTTVVPADLHPKSKQLIAQFAKQMAYKMRKAELNHGYGAGWLDDDWEDLCKRDFHAHVAKGEPTDLAVYSAFMWHHGWRF